MIIDSTRIPAMMAITTLKGICHLAEVGSSTPTKLAKEIGVSTAAITDLICRLESLGYAKRKNHPKDLRGYVITITPAGRLFVEGLRPLAFADTREASQA
jgi:DNA-binding MarR family transcriptional regulator